MTISPLALPFPDLPQVAGVTLRVARARYKEWDRCDLTFAELAPGTLFERLPHGGHVGFIGGTFRHPDYYLERRIPDWLVSQQTSPSGR